MKKKLRWVRLDVKSGKNEKAKLGYRSKSGKNENSQVRLGWIRLEVEKWQK